MSYRHEIENFLKRMYHTDIQIIEYRHIDNEIYVVFKIPKFNQEYIAHFEIVNSNVIPREIIDRKQEQDLKTIKLPKTEELESFIEEELEKTIEEIEKTPTPPEVGIDIEYCQDIIKTYQESVLKYLERFKIPVEEGGTIKYRYLHEVDFMNRIIFFRRLIDYFICRIKQKMDKSIFKHYDFYLKYLRDREEGKIRVFTGPVAIVRKYAVLKVLCFENENEVLAFQALLTFLESLIKKAKTIEFKPEAKGLKIQQITVIPPYLKELEYIHALLSLVFDGKCIKSWSYESALKTFYRIREILLRIYYNYAT